MKRTPLRRGKPLRRTGGLQRTGFLNRYAPMKKENKERKKKARALDFGELAKYVRGLPCCAPGCGAPAPSDPAHVHSRGAGYHAWRENGDGNILSFCRKHHDLQGLKGWSAIHHRGIEWGELQAKTIGERFKTIVY